MSDFLLQVLIIIGFYLLISAVLLLPLWLLVWIFRKYGINFVEYTGIKWWSSLVGLAIAPCLTTGGHTGLFVPLFSLLINQDKDGPFFGLYTFLGFPFSFIVAYFLFRIFSESKN